MKKFRSSNLTNRSTSSLKRGFTLIELILIIGIIVSLLAVSSLNLLGPQHQSALTAQSNTLLSDLRLQQFKAMTGDTEGRGVLDSYGLFIQSNSYTLFPGTSYSAGNSNNIVIPLPSSVSLSTDFPSSTIIFNKGDGQINGFTPGLNTVTITDTQEGRTTVIELNVYGVPNIQN